MYKINIDAYYWNAEQINEKVDKSYLKSLSKKKLFFSKIVRDEIWNQ